MQVILVPASSLQLFTYIRHDREPWKGFDAAATSAVALAAYIKQVARMRVGDANLSSATEKEKKKTKTLPLSTSSCCMLTTLPTSHCQGKV